MSDLAVKLVDIVPDGSGFAVIAVGTASRRQFRAAMEGACPGCGSDVLEVEEIRNSRFCWAHCADCCWSMWFRANTGTEHHVIWRVVGGAWNRAEAVADKQTVSDKDLPG